MFQLDEGVIYEGINIKIKHIRDLGFCQGFWFEIAKNSTAKMLI